MRKRQDFPGPISGFMTCLTAHFDSVTASANCAWKLPAGFRPLAVSYVQPAAASGTTASLTLNAIRSTTGIVTGTTNPITAVIDLKAAASGIRYFGVDDARAAAGLVGDDPQMPVPGETAANTATHLIARVIINTATVTDLTVCVWGVVTDHINADKVND